VICSGTDTAPCGFASTSASWQWDLPSSFSSVAQCLPEQAGQLGSVLVRAIDPLVALLSEREGRKATRGATDISWPLVTGALRGSMAGCTPEARCVSFCYTIKCSGSATSRQRIVQAIVQHVECRDLITRPLHAHTESSSIYFGQSDHENNTASVLTLVTNATGIRLLEPFFDKTVFCTTRFHR
jgi:hypothetical protein